MRIGIYYFTGTGNTSFIAEQFRKEMKDFQQDDKVHQIELFQIDSNTIVLSDLDLLIIGGPIYAGNMPEKLLKWAVKNIPKTNTQTKAMVYSTSAGLGNPHGVNSIASKLEKKGYDVIRKDYFEMPRNFYFNRYEAHTEEEIENRFRLAKERVKQWVVEFLDEEIEPREAFSIDTKGIWNKDILAGVFSFMAKKMGKNFSADQACIECGQCVDNCPQNNISLEASGIKYKNQCMMCTRCIHGCPVNAIMYNDQKFVQYNHLLLNNKS